jgi:hypothetical protein
LAMKNILRPYFNFICPLYAAYSNMHTMLYMSFKLNILVKEIFPKLFKDLCSFEKILNCVNKGRLEKKCKTAKFQVHVIAISRKLHTLYCNWTKILFPKQFKFCGTPNNPLVGRKFFFIKKDTFFLDFYFSNIYL